MKKLIGLVCAALMLTALFAGCGNSNKEVSARESVASEVASAPKELVEDIGEGVTSAVSAVGSEIERMAENGKVSDSDGIIGNESINE